LNRVFKISFSVSDETFKIRPVKSDAIELGTGLILLGLSTGSVILLPLLIIIWKYQLLFGFFKNNISSGYVVVDYGILIPYAWYSICTSTVLVAIVAYYGLIHIYSASQWLCPTRYNKMALYRFI